MRREINNDLLHEALMRRKPLLAFDENANYDEWKAQIKAKYLELLGMEEIAQNACELKVEVEEVVKQDGYTRYRYVFETEKGYGGVYAEGYRVFLIPRIAVKFYTHICHNCKVFPRAKH